jgi:hypothetical protein
MHWMHMLYRRGYPRPALGAVVAAASLLAGCGGTEGTGGAGADAPSPVPVPTGRGPAFRLAPRPPALRGQAVDGARCSADPGPRVQAHIELFARGAVVPVPPGIGVVPPLVRDGAYVRGGRCSYPVRTTEPTGLLELRQGRPLPLGRLFAIWGQPLSPTRLAGFRASPRAPVRAYLNGRRWRGDPRDLPLTRHAVVALEVGPHIAPHARYRFPDAA